MGLGVLFQVVKCLSGYEADHSTLSGASVRVSGAVVLVLLCAFLACTGTVTAYRLYGMLGILMSCKVLTSAVAGHNH